MLETINPSISPKHNKLFQGEISRIKTQKYRTVSPTPWGLILIISPYELSFYLNKAEQLVSMGYS